MSITEIVSPGLWGKRDLGLCGGEEENAASARILWDVQTPEAGGTGRKSVSPELLGGAGRGGPGGRGDSLRLSRVNLFPIHEPPRPTIPS